MSGKNEKASLPPVEDMLKFCEQEEESKKDLPTKHWHMFGDYQFDYNDMICQMTSGQNLPIFYKQMYKEAWYNKSVDCNYRDT